MIIPSTADAVGRILPSATRTLAAVSLDSLALALQLGDRGVIIISISIRLAKPCTADLVVHLQQVRKSQDPRAKDHLVGCIHVVCVRVVGALLCAPRGRVSPSGE